MTRDKSQEVLRKHALWVRNEPGGEKANLKGVNLEGAYLKGANLEGVNLEGANLAGANLERVYLYGANLKGAYLKGAYLKGANLEGAYLKGAYLKGVNLEGASLGHYQLVPEEGEIIGWKKVGVHIVKLRIPADAERTSTPLGRKCRASDAIVLDIQPPPATGESIYACGCSASLRTETAYSVGAHVFADFWDDDPRLECTHGIHFFITEQEAREW